MKLLRLTMQGFKSFADKTTVDFADGMTVIVGPNGTGKSNISDAVRWVLGEQNVRNLRGEKTEDIIFSGSEGRKPKNAAEVTLVLDNSHHELPLDTVQVAITRRVLRDGESTFQINRRNCRLKDVQELLAQVGLGKGSMAIIGQNRVDEVLTARPEERRLIFEEVAGISLYRMRKNEGLRKLEHTDENMTRVQDLMALLDEQLVTLKEEAEKSKSYHAFMDQKKRIEATMLLLRMTSTRRMLARYENEARSLEDEAVHWKTVVSEISAKQAKLENEELHHQEEVRQLSVTLSQKEQEVERSLGDYRVKEESLKHLKESILSLRESIQSEEEEEKTLAEDIEKIKGELAAAKAKLDDKSKTLSEKERLHDEIKKKLDDAHAAYQKKLAARQQSLMDKERWTREIEHAESDISQFSKQEEGWAETAEKLKEEIGRLTSEIHSMGKGEASLTKQLKEQEEKGKELHQIIDRKQNNADDLHKKLDALTGELRQIELNTRYLERADQEHASFSRAAKVILENKNRFGSSLIGAVGDLVRVPSKYTEAAEIVLGGALSHIVTKTSQDAAQMIQWLKKNHLGRATFYPLDAMKSRTPSSTKREAAQEQGIYGIASDLFQYDKAYANVMEYLLGRTLIAEDLDTAREVAKKYQYRLRIVTLDGQLLSPGGSMTGGSMRKKEQTFFGRKKEIAEGKSKVKELQERISNLSSEEQVVLKEISKSTEELTHCRESWQESHTELASLTGQKQGLKGNLSLEERNLQSIENSRKTAEAQREQAEKNKKDALEKLSALGMIEELPPDTEGASLEKEEESLSQELMNLRVETSGIEKDIAFHESSLKDKYSYQEKLQNEKAEYEQKIEANEKESTNLQSELSQLNEHTGELKEKLQEIQKEQEDLQNGYDAFVMQKKQNEEAWRDAQRKEAEADKKRAEIDGRAESFKEQERQVLGQLQENGLTLASAEALRLPGTMEDMKKQKSQVEGNIIRLGNVNPNGVEAYEMQLRRKESYETQMEDLQKSKDDLQKVLTDIDQTMTKQFTAGFTEINKEFSRIMQVMFQGGKARLELTDPDHPLEGGVEMYLQLPGKKRQPLSLMSGGERALTVVALLISFMAYHPAPFCFVDEIDAALDDANVERYSRMIGDYKKRTQFIVISHRKKTMEFADTLQGVTMAEKGVSSLITVHMSDYFGNDEKQ